jgi:hypothetical protein
MFEKSLKSRPTKPKNQRKQENPKRISKKKPKNPTRKQKYGRKRKKCL